MGGDGSFRVDVSGLPSGVEAAVTVDGAGGAQVVTASSTLTLSAGMYTVVASVVAGPDDPVVREVYRPSIDAASATACVREGEMATVTVTYALVETSHKLWTAGGPGGAAPTVAFASEILRETGPPSATVLAHTWEPRSQTFDPHGNLWVLGGTVADPTLSRYDSDTLDTVTQTAQREIVIEDTGCSPGASALAFDPSGNLWVSYQCADAVIRLSPAELAVSGSLTPSFRIEGVTAPRALTFDANGNLWVANDQIVRFDADTLGDEGATAARMLTLGSTGDATEATADALAFDTAGNLWVAVSSNYNFAKLTAAQLAGSGAESVSPSAYISVGVDSIPGAPAFDDSGALWFAHSAGSFARLTSEQLAVNTTYAAPTTPSVVIASPSVGYAGTIAFFPAAAGLPLVYALE